MPLTSRFLTALVLLLPTLHAPAQAPAARQRILDAHTVVLTNGGGADDTTNQRALEALGTALRQVNGFNVTDNPGRADLALKLFCDTKRVHGKQQHVLRLTISNPADSLLLWTLSETVPSTPAAHGAWGQHFETVATRLSLDLKNLATGQPSGL